MYIYIQSDIKSKEILLVFFYKNSILTNNDSHQDYFKFRILIKLQIVLSI